MSDEKVTTQDMEFMSRAFELAKKGYGRVSPNPYVGAVIVKDGKIIGEGFHERVGENHAETNALESATESVIGATLYITLEPCCHVGKTGACTDAIIESGIIRVVTAIEDPNPKVRGNGHQILRDHNIEVITNVALEKAHEMNRIFITNQYKKRPFITLKAALSLDGKLATRTRDSQWITGEDAKEYAHYLRGLHDAILIGKGTLLSDNPTLNVRYGHETRLPLRVLVINNFDGLHKNFNLFDTSIAATAILYRADCKIPEQLYAELTEHKIELIPIVSTAPLIIVEKLYEKGIYSLFIEGGAALYDAFFSADIIDEYALFYGPKFIGNSDALELWKTSPITRLQDAPNVQITKLKMLGTSFYVQAFNKEKEA